MFSFIRIRKAKNGYIFKKRTQWASDDNSKAENEDDYEYELVTEEELNQKFGEACNPGSVQEEDGEVVVCIEFCKAKIYDKKKHDLPETFMKAKKMYAAYQHEKFAPKDVVILELEDKDDPTLECFDEDAERVNRITNMKITEKDKVRYIKLSATLENKRLLGSCNPHVLKTSKSEILLWYEGTKIYKEW